MNVTYENHVSGRHNMTVATLEDGRVMSVDLQYGVVLPRGTHAVGCDQTTKIGGRCNCGMLDGVDVDALVEHARQHGRRGPAPTRETEPTPRTIARDNAPCPKCGTWCEGDCHAH